MGLMKKLTSALVASSLVLSLVGSAFAAYTPGAGEAAGTRMQKLGIIQGRDGGDLALNSEITRAELVTTIVRAFGQEENAKYLKGSTIFPDISSHWASGNIAMAVALVEKAGGDAIGMPDGTFAPDVKLTPAQAVAFLMKFVGLKADANKAWPANYLDVAVEKGIITAEDKALIAAETGNATRGLTFYLFDNAFYNYKLADGKTFYTKYVVPNGPTLTMNDLADTTMDSKVTVTGNAKGAIEVYVGSTKVTPDASGNFTAEFALPEVKAEPYTVTVTAIDLAGNRVEKSDTIARVVGNIASVEAEAITVAAGATVDVAAVAKDEGGNVIADAAITGESALGTFADGKFTAGKTTGTGTLTLTAGEKTGTVNVTVTAGPLAKVVADKVSAAPGEIVTLSAQDEFGNVISGATFTQTSADAMLDGATGKFMASKAGNYTVTAKVGTVEKTATIGVFAGFGKTAKVVVEAPQTIVGNSESVVTVTAKVVDANGNVVGNYNDGIELEAIANLTAEEKTDKNGVATYEISASNLLTGQVLALKAKSTKDSDVKGETAIQVIQQVATSIDFAAPTYLAINKADGTISGPATAYVTVLDQNGEAMLHGAYAVTLDLSGTAATFAADSSEKNSTTVVYDGSANSAGKAVSIYPRSLTSTGEVTITASLTGLTSGTDKITAAYAQAPSQVNLAVTTTEDLYTANVATKAEKVTFRAQLRDANGVPATSTSDKTVTLDLGIADFSKVKIYEIDALGARIDSDADGANGLTPLTANPTAVITAGTTSVSKSFESETFIGDLSVTAKVTNMTSGTAKATFVSGPAYSISFARTSVKVAQGTESVDLTAQVYDEAGNKVLKAGKAVYFTANGTNAWVNGAEKATVETDANGVATVKVTTIGYFNVAAFDGAGAWISGGYKVSINPAADATNLVVKPSGSLDSYVSVDNSVASTVTVKTQKGGTDVFYVKTTDNITLLATVKDAKGQPVTNDTVKAVFPKGTVIVDGAGNLAAAGTANASDKTVTMVYNAGTGYYELANVYFAKAPTATFTVKDTSGVSDIVATSTLAVAPATASKIVVSSADSNDKVAYTKGQVSGPFTLQLTDAFGNPVYADATTGDIKIDWAYPAVDASAGQYFEIKASATGARLTGGTTATDSNLVIKQGSNSVTFYVFGNVDGTVTFNATGSVMGALTSSDATTFDQ